MPTDPGQIVVRLEGAVVQTVSLTAAVLTIGRLPDNALTLASPEVSRHHAELRREGSGFALTDLGSANGTLVAGVRLPANQPHLLTSGDVIRIGPFVLDYQAPEPPTPVVTLPPVAAQQADDASVGVAAPSAEMTIPEREPPAVESAPAEAVPVPTNGAHAAEVPPQPPEVPPVAEVPPPPPLPPGRPTQPAPLAPGPTSSYTKYLPAIYQEGDFLGRFLLIPESIGEPIEQRQDHIEAYFDPKTCPPSFVFWLASWLDFALNDHWPEARCRRLLAEAMDLYRWRGTRYGLTRVIELCTELTPQITDLSLSGAPGPAQPFVFHVSIRIPPDSGVDRELIETLIRTHKPAHCGYVLEVKP